MNLSHCPFLLILLTLCGSVGCTGLAEWMENDFKVGPNYVRPKAQVSSRWRDFNDPMVINHRYGVDDVAWWRRFGDPKLDRLIHRALCGNLPLHQAKLGVLEAIQLRAIAKGNLFPQKQEAFARYQRTQVSENGNSFGIQGIDLANFDLYEFGFNTSWELDMWGKFRRAVESREAKIESAVENQRDVQVSLIANIAATYIRYREYQQRIQYAQSNIKTQKKSQELESKRVKAGTNNRLNLTQAISNLEVTKTLIPDLQRRLHETNNQLCVLMGIPPIDLRLDLGIGPIPAVSGQLPIGVPRDLIRRRPDIRRAEREIAAQNALIGVAKAELFPTFSIVGTINWQAFDLDDLFDSSSNGGSIIPGVNWNILNYGRLTNNVRVQETRRAQAVMNYRQTILQANEETDNAIILYVKSSKQVQFLGNAVKAKVESLEIAQKEYKEDKISYDRVNRLQRELVELQDSLARKRSESSRAMVGMYRALAGGWSQSQPGSRCASRPQVRRAPHRLAARQRAAIPVGGPQPSRSRPTSNRSNWVPPHAARPVSAAHRTASSTGVSRSVPPPQFMNRSHQVPFRKARSVSVTSPRGLRTTVAPVPRYAGAQLHRQTQPPYQPPHKWFFQKPVPKSPAIKVVPYLPQKRVKVSQKPAGMSRRPVNHSSLPRVVPQRRPAQRKTSAAYRQWRNSWIHKGPVVKSPPSR